MKKIKSGVKKILKSKVFKVVAAAALIYVGGAALGAWKAPGALARVNGVLRAGGSAGTAGGAGATASTTGAAAAPALGPIAAAPAAAPTAGQAIANSVMPQVAGGTAANTVAATAATPMSGVMLPGGAGGAAETGIKKGVISRMMEGAANAAQSTASWVNRNPMPAAMIAQGVAGALTPDQMELKQEEQRLAVEEDERQRRQRNEALRMDGTESQYQPTYQPLKFASTGQPLFANNGVLRQFQGVR